MHLHRSLLISILIICLLLIYILFCQRRRILSMKQHEIENDEDINLVDLFHHAFKLTYQAGRAISILKNTNETLKNILNKKSFKHLPNEPVTIADFTSHSIITNGLMKKFRNLQVLKFFNILYE